MILPITNSGDAQVLAYDSGFFAIDQPCPHRTNELSSSQVFIRRLIYHLIAVIKELTQLRIICGNME